MKIVKLLCASFILALSTNAMSAETSKMPAKPVQAVENVENQVPAKAMVEEKSNPDIKAMNLLNINHATADEIKNALVGIGAKKAEAIVQYREKHGNFTNIEQLLEVQGIGKATLEKNKDRIRIE